MQSTPRLTTSESYAEFLARDEAHRNGFGKPEMICSWIETRTEGRQQPLHVACFGYVNGAVSEFDGAEWRHHLP